MNVLDGTERLKALVYSSNKELALQCSESFKDLPVDWVEQDNKSSAADLLTKAHFRFVLLDLRSSGGAALLESLRAAGISRTIVLVISSAPIDPTVLQMCYKSQFFYPVRPGDIRDQLCRAIALAELSSARDSSVPIEGELVSLEGASPSAVVLLRDRMLHRFARVLRMQHSLSIAAHERLASLLAVAGAIWLAGDIHANFKGLASIGSPSAGPTYLVALSVLLWLCAKSRRVSNGLDRAVEVGAHNWS